MTGPLRPGEDAARAEVAVDLVQAGVHWDAIKVATSLGEAVLDHLADKSGAVIDDGRHLYWLIRPEAAEELQLPGAEVLSTATFVAVPAEYRLSRPGIHWRRTPGENGLHTCPLTLRDALTLVQRNQAR
ncbi:hypothetical protein SRB5_16150 [Streptomyces sp. RB5]|uniref:Uncharacterized protein n=1 Tax=Streptomyces smaragdinus TaxID=2585196 RepID=A0A7K0CDN7_9ACTN|nr:hypothetical protein [Streptomyces smaragdinus]MQY11496.1 hypothetical protein [Streptomyces smaragdinus]